MDNPKQKNHLAVTIKSPEKTEFNGTAKAITSFNKTGKFDILPYHANFISIIKDSIVLYLEDDKQVTILLKRGIVKAHKDQIHILIGI